MDIVLSPRKLRGTIILPPSKSILHRRLFLAAFSKESTTFILKNPSQDILATIDVLKALGATISLRDDAITITPGIAKKSAIVNCKESATTLRLAMMILPTKIPKITFMGEGSLKKRPVEEALRYLKGMGVLTKGDRLPIHTSGIYVPRDAEIDAAVSSQFASGALIAAVVGKEPTTIRITNANSTPYIHMSAAILKESGVSVQRQGDSYRITPVALSFKSPVETEADASHAAFIYAANALGNDIHITGKVPSALQGDAAYFRLLEELKTRGSVNLRNHPDLLMPLACAATKWGGRFHGIGRLKYKESDRVMATATLLNALGVKAETTDDSLSVFAGDIQGGIVHSFGDHRIAFCAAVLSTVAKEPITLIDAEATEKSWHNFWGDFDKLKEK